MENMHKFCMNDDFIIHVEILEEYFCSKDVKDEVKKRSHLLTSLNMDVYILLRNLLSPKTPKDVSYADLVTVMKKQFARQSIKYKERRKFYEAAQNTGENVKDYFNKIKGLAVTCEFGAQLDHVLKDKFICGMLKGAVFDKLCEFGIDNDLNKCVEIAMQRETILEEAAACHKISKRHNKKSSNQVLSKQAQKMKPTNDTRSDTKKKNSAKCNACGKSNHNFKFCKYRKYECKGCGQTGHLQRVCGSNKFLEVGEAENADQQNQSFSLYSLTLEDKYSNSKSFYDCMTASNNCFNIHRSDSDNFMMVLEVDKVPLKFEIDTGSAISAISERLYRKYFTERKLKPFNKILKSYNGAPIPVEGCFDAMIGFKSGKTVSISLLVIRTESNPLVGRDVLNKIGFNISLNSIEFDNDLKKIVSEFPSVFSARLGKYKHELIKLDLKDDVPVFMTPRKVPFAYRTALENELMRLEEAGVICKTDLNAWGTPLVTVIKKDGSIRVCADYSCTVNPKIKDYNYPLPKIDDIFEKLRGGKFFTKLDLSEAYHQLELDNDTKRILAWSTHVGIFLVNRLPFGCKPNISIFQCVIEKVLLGCSNTVVFIDDIVVTGRNEIEHNKNLRVVLMKLENAGLTLNKSKCEFKRKSISYLGYIIDSNGLHKDPAKIEAIVNMPIPKDKTEAKSFCGLVNYYRRFLPNLATILKPLYESFSDKKFSWTPECSKSMKTVKDLVTSDLVLAHYDESKPTILTCDASEHGLGACLSQVGENEERPVAFVSRVLSTAEKNYSVIDKEACAIHFGVKKFEQFLLGRKFKIRTDHKPLTMIFGTKKGLPTMSANRLTRWGIYLSSFDFEIIYVKGVMNGCADALSRLTDIVEISETESVLKFIDNSLSRPIKYDDVAKQSAIDPILKHVMNYVKTGWPCKKSIDEELHKYYQVRDELSIDEDILMRQNRVVIPLKFRNILLNEIHSGHIGICRAKELIRSYFWWPSVDKEIESLIKSCQVCREHQANPSRCEPTPWPETKYAFERIHIDFCGPIKNFYFLVLIDAHTKWVEVFKMRSITSKDTITNLETVFAVFGFCKVLVSDNGTSLTSYEFESFCKTNGIRHIKSPPYHPPSNGQAEKAVRNFKQSIKKQICNVNPSGDIDRQIKTILYMSRNTINTTTKKTPYENMFGRKPILRWDELKPKPKTNITYDSKLTIAQYVYAKDFRNGKYMLGRIVKVIGNKMFEVRLENGLIWKRHINHLTPAHIMDENKIEMTSDDITHQKSRLDDILKTKVAITDTMNNKSPRREMISSDAQEAIRDIVDETVPMLPDISVEMNPSPQPDISEIRPRRQIRKPDKLNL